MLQIILANRWENFKMSLGRQTYSYPLLGANSSSEVIILKLAPHKLQTEITKMHVCLWRIAARNQATCK